MSILAPSVKLHLGTFLSQDLGTELARANVDWVQVAGNGAEALHDAIDCASGRHGDGSPMTSWHNEARSVEEMAEVASLCFGGRERVLVLVVGQAREFRASVKALNLSLKQQHRSTANRSNQSHPTKAPRFTSHPKSHSVQGRQFRNPKSSPSILDLTPAG